jgi:hypothetical protein
MVVRDGVVKILPVSIGADNGRRVGVQGKLSASDEVIVNPDSSLAEGTPVQPTLLENPG